MQSKKNKKAEFEWRTGRTCHFKIFLHLVFTTKYRRNVISKEIIVRFQEIFHETMTQMDGELLEFNGEDDHVHMLVSINPKTSISNLVGKLKGKSSFLVRKEFWPQIKNKLWGSHFWSPSYCVVSCGGAPLEKVKEYVKNQRTPPSQLQINRSKRFTGKKRVNKQWRSDTRALTHS